MKWIYLARRAPGVDREDFPRRWRDHAKLAAKFPDLAGYFQGTIYCHSGATQDAIYDAGAILLLEDEAAIRTVLAHPDAVGTMHPDELRVFEDLIETLSLAADERLIFDGPDGTHLAMVLLEAPDAEAEHVEALLRTAALPDGLRFVLDVVRPGVFPTRHPWTAVIELHGTADQCRTAAHGAAEIMRRLGPVTIVDGPTILRWRRSAEISRG